MSSVDRSPYKTDQTRTEYMSEELVSKPRRGEFEIFLYNPIVMIFFLLINHLPCLLSVCNVFLRGELRRFRETKDSYHLTLDRVVPKVHFDPSKT